MAANDDQIKVVERTFYDVPSSRMFGGKSRGIQKTPGKAALIRYGLEDLSPANSENIVNDIKKHIREAQPFIRKTPRFVNRIRKEIMYLHNYNSKVLNGNGVYPLTESMRNLLIIYIELEMAILSLREYNNAEYIKSVQHRITRLLSTIYSSYWSQPNLDSNPNNKWKLMALLFEDLDIKIHEAAEEIRRMFIAKIDLSKEEIDSRSRFVWDFLKKPKQYIDFNEVVAESDSDEEDHYFGIFSKLAASKKSTPIKKQKELKDCIDFSNEDNVDLDFDEEELDISLKQEPDDLLFYERSVATIDITDNDKSKETHLPENKNQYQSPGSTHSRNKLLKMPGVSDHCDLEISVGSKEIFSSGNIEDSEVSKDTEVCKTNLHIKQISERAFEKSSSSKIFANQVIDLLDSDSDDILEIKQEDDVLFVTKNTELLLPKQTNDIKKESEVKIETADIVTDLEKLLDCTDKRSAENKHSTIAVTGINTLSHGQSFSLLSDSSDSEIESIPNKSNTKEGKESPKTPPRKKNKNVPKSAANEKCSLLFDDENKIKTPSQKGWKRVENAKYDPSEPVKDTQLLEEVHIINKIKAGTESESSEVFDIRDSVASNIPEPVKDIQCSSERQSLNKDDRVLNRNQKYFTTEPVLDNKKHSKISIDPCSNVTQKISVSDVQQQKSKTSEPNFKVVQMVTPIIRSEILQESISEVTKSVQPENLAKTVECELQVERADKAIIVATISTTANVFQHAGSTQETVTFTKINEPSNEVSKSVGFVEIQSENVEKAVTSALELEKPNIAIVSELLPETADVGITNVDVIKTHQNPDTFIINDNETTKSINFIKIQPENAVIPKLESNVPNETIVSDSTPVTSDVLKDVDSAEICQEAVTFKKINDLTSGVTESADFIDTPSKNFENAVTSELEVQMANKTMVLESISGTVAVMDIDTTKASDFVEIQPEKVNNSVMSELEIERSNVTIVSESLSKTVNIETIEDIAEICKKGVTSKKIIEPTSEATQLLNFVKIQPANLKNAVISELESNILNKTIVSDSIPVISDVHTDVDSTEICQKAVTFKKIDDLTSGVIDIPSENFDNAITAELELQMANKTIILESISGYGAVDVMYTDTKKASDFVEIQPEKLKGSVVSKQEIERFNATIVSKSSETVNIETIEDITEICKHAVTSKKINEPTSEATQLVDFVEIPSENVEHAVISELKSNISNKTIVSDSLPVTSDVLADVDSTEICQKAVAFKKIDDLTSESVDFIDIPSDNFDKAVTSELELQMANKTMILESISGTVDVMDIDTTKASDFVEIQPEKVKGSVLSKLEIERFNASIVSESSETVNVETIEDIKEICETAVTFKKINEPTSEVTQSVDFVEIPSENVEHAAISEIELNIPNKTIVSDSLPETAVDTTEICGKEFTSKVIESADFMEIECENFENAVTSAIGIKGSNKIIVSESLPETTDVVINLNRSETVTLKQIAEPTSEATKPVDSVEIQTENLKNAVISELEPNITNKTIVSDSIPVTSDVLTEVDSKEICQKAVTFKKIDDLTSGVTESADFIEIPSENVHNAVTSELEHQMANKTIILESISRTIDVMDIDKTKASDFVEIRPEKGKDSVISELEIERSNATFVSESLSETVNIETIEDIIEICEKAVTFKKMNEPTSEATQLVDFVKIPSENLANAAISEIELNILNKSIVSDSLPETAVNTTEICGKEFTSEVIESADFVEIEYKNFENAVTCVIGNEGPNKTFVSESLPKSVDVVMNVNRTETVTLKQIDEPTSETKKSVDFVEIQTENLENKRTLKTIISELVCESDDIVKNLDSTKTVTPIAVNVTDSVEAASSDVKSAGINDELFNETDAGTHQHKSVPLMNIEKSSATCKPVVRKWDIEEPVYRDRSNDMGISTIFESSEELNFQADVSIENVHSESTTTDINNQPTENVKINIHVSNDICEDIEVTDSAVIRERKPISNANILMLTPKEPSKDEVLAIVAAASSNRSTLRRTSEPNLKKKLITAKRTNESLDKEILLHNQKKIYKGKFLETAAIATSLNQNNISTNSKQSKETIVKDFNVEKDLFNTCSKIAILTDKNDFSQEEKNFKGSLRSSSKSEQTYYLAPSSSNFPEPIIVDGLEYSVVGIKETKKTINVSVFMPTSDVNKQSIHDDINDFDSETEDAYRVKKKERPVKKSREMKSTKILKQSKCQKETNKQLGKSKEKCLKTTDSEVLLKFKEKSILTDIDGFKGHTNIEVITEEGDSESSFLNQSNDDLEYTLEFNDENNVQENEGVYHESIYQSDILELEPTCTQQKSLCDFKKEENLNIKSDQLNEPMLPAVEEEAEFISLYELEFIAENLKNTEGEQVYLKSLNSEKVSCENREKAEYSPNKNIFDTSSKSNEGAITSQVSKMEGKSSIELNFTENVLETVQQPESLKVIEDMREVQPSGLENVDDKMFQESSEVSVTMQGSESVQAAQVIPDKDETLELHNNLAALQAKLDQKPSKQVVVESNIDPGQQLQSFPFTEGTCLNLDDNVSTMEKPQKLSNLESKSIVTTNETVQQLKRAEGMQEVQDLKLGVTGKSLDIQSNICNSKDESIKKSIAVQDSNSKITIEFNLDASKILESKVELKIFDGNGTKIQDSDVDLQSLADKKEVEQIDELKKFENEKHLRMAVKANTHDDSKVKMHYHVDKTNVTEEVEHSTNLKQMDIENKEHLAFQLRSETVYDIPLDMTRKNLLNETVIIHQQENTQEISTKNENERLENNATKINNKVSIPIKNVPINILQNFKADSEVCVSYQEVVSEDLPSPIKTLQYSLENSSKISNSLSYSPVNMRTDCDYSPVDFSAASDGINALASVASLKEKLPINNVYQQVQCNMLHEDDVITGNDSDNNLQIDETLTYDTSDCVRVTKKHQKLFKETARIPKSKSKRSKTIPELNLNSPIPTIAGLNITPVFESVSPTNLGYKMTKNLNEIINHSTSKPKKGRKARSPIKATFGQPSTCQSLLPISPTTSSSVLSPLLFPKLSPGLTVHECKSVPQKPKNEAFMMANLLMNPKPLEKSEITKLSELAIAAIACARSEYSGILASTLDVKPVSGILSKGESNCKPLCTKASLKSFESNKATYLNLYQEPLEYFNKSGTSDTLITPEPVIVKNYVGNQYTEILEGPKKSRKSKYSKVQLSNLSNFLNEESAVKDEPKFLQKDTPLKNNTEIVTLPKSTVPTLNDSEKTMINLQLTDPYNTKDVLDSDDEVPLSQRVQKKPRLFIPLNKSIANVKPDVTAIKADSGVKRSRGRPRKNQSAEPSYKLRQRSKSGCYEKANDTCLNSPESNEKEKGIKNSEIEKPFCQMKTAPEPKTFLLDPENQQDSNVNHIECKPVIYRTKLRSQSGSTDTGETLELVIQKDVKLPTKSVVEKKPSKRGRKSKKSTKLHINTSVTQLPEVEVKKCEKPDEIDHIFKSLSLISPKTAITPKEKYKLELKAQQIAAGISPLGVSPTEMELLPTQSVSTLTSIHSLAGLLVENKPSPIKTTCEIKADIKPVVPPAKLRRKSTVVELQPDMCLTNPTTSSPLLKEKDVIISLKCDVLNIENEGAVAKENIANLLTKNIEGPTPFKVEEKETFSRSESCVSSRIKTTKEFSIEKIQVIDKSISKSQLEISQVSKTTKDQEKNAVENKKADDLNGATNSKNHKNVEEQQKANKNLIHLNTENISLKCTLTPTIEKLKRKLEAEGKAVIFNTFENTPCTIVKDNDAQDGKKLKREYRVTPKTLCIDSSKKESPNNLGNNDTEKVFFQKELKIHNTKNQALNVDSENKPSILSMDISNNDFLKILEGNNMVNLVCNNKSSNNVVNGDKSDENLNQIVQADLSFINTKKQSTNILVGNDKTVVSKGKRNKIVVAEPKPIGESKCDVSKEVVSTKKLKRKFQAKDKSLDISESEPSNDSVDDDIKDVVLKLTLTSFNDNNFHTQEDTLELGKSEESVEESNTGLKIHEKNIFSNFCSDKKHEKQTNNTVPSEYTSSLHAVLANEQIYENKATIELLQPVQDGTEEKIIFSAPEIQNVIKSTAFNQERVNEIVKTDPLKITTSEIKEHTYEHKSNEVLRVEGNVQCDKIKTTGKKEPDELKQKSSKTCTSEGEPEKDMLKEQLTQKSSKTCTKKEEREEDKLKEKIIHTKKFEKTIDLKEKADQIKSIAKSDKKHKQGLEKSNEIKTKHVTHRSKKDDEREKSQSISDAGRTRSLSQKLEYTTVLELSSTSIDRQEGKLHEKVKKITDGKHVSKDGNSRSRSSSFKHEEILQRKDRKEKNRHSRKRERSIAKDLKKDYKSDQRVINEIHSKSEQNGSVMKSILREKDLAEKSKSKDIKGGNFAEDSFTSKRESKKEDNHKSKKEKLLPNEKQVKAPHFENTHISKDKRKKEEKDKSEKDKVLKLIPNEKQIKSFEILDEKVIDDIFIHKKLMQNNEAKDNIKDKNKNLVNIKTEEGKKQKECKDADKKNKHSKADPFNEMEVPESDKEIYPSPPKKQFGKKDAVENKDKYFKSRELKDIQEPRKDRIKTKIITQDSKIVKVIKKESEATDTKETTKIQTEGTKLNEIKKSTLTNEKLSKESLEKITTDVLKLKKKEIDKQKKSNKYNEREKQEKLKKKEFDKKEKLNKHNERENQDTKTVKDTNKHRKRVSSPEDDLPLSKLERKSMPGELTASVAEIQKKDAVYNFTLPVSKLDTKNLKERKKQSLDTNVQHTGDAFKFDSLIRKDLFIKLTALPVSSEEALITKKSKIISLDKNKLKDVEHSMELPVTKYLKSIQPIVVEDAISAEQGSGQESVSLMGDNVTNVLKEKDKPTSKITQVETDIVEASIAQVPKVIESVFEKTITSKCLKPEPTQPVIVDKVNISEQYGSLESVVPIEVADVLQVKDNIVPHMQIKPAEASLIEAPKIVESLDHKILYNNVLEQEKTRQSSKSTKPEQSQLIIVEVDSTKNNEGIESVISTEQSVINVFKEKNEVTDSDRLIPEVVESDSSIHMQIESVEASVTQVPKIVELLHEKCLYDSILEEGSKRSQPVVVDEVPTVEQSVIPTFENVTDIIKEKEDHSTSKLKDSDINPVQESMLQVKSLDQKSSDVIIVEESKSNESLKPDQIYSTGLDMSLEEGNVKVFQEKESESSITAVADSAKCTVSQMQIDSFQVIKAVPLFDKNISEAIKRDDTKTENSKSNVVELLNHSTSTTSNIKNYDYPSSAQEENTPFDYQPQPKNDVKVLTYTSHSATELIGPKNIDDVDTTTPLSMDPKICTKTGLSENKNKKTCQKTSKKSCETSFKNKLVTNCTNGVKSKTFESSVHDSCVNHLDLKEDNVSKENVILQDNTTKNSDMKTVTYPKLNKVLNPVEQSEENISKKPGCSYSLDETKMENTLDIENKIHHNTGISTVLSHQTGKDLNSLEKSTENINKLSPAQEKVLSTNLNDKTKNRLGSLREPRFEGILVLSDYNSAFHGVKTPEPTTTNGETNKCLKATVDQLYVKLDEKSIDLNHIIEKVIGDQVAKTSTPVLKRRRSASDDILAQDIVLNQTEKNSENIWTLQENHSSGEGYVVIDPSLKLCHFVTDQDLIDTIDITKKQEYSLVESSHGEDIISKTPSPRKKKCQTLQALIGGIRQQIQQGESAVIKTSIISNPVQLCTLSQISETQNSAKKVCNTRRRKSAAQVIEDTFNMFLHPINDQTQQLNEEYVNGSTSCSAESINPDNLTEVTEYCDQTQFIPMSVEEILVQNGPVYSTSNTQPDVHINNSLISNELSIYGSVNTVHSSAHLVYSQNVTSSTMTSAKMRFDEKSLSNMNVTYSQQIVPSSMSVTNIGTETGDSTLSAEDILPMHYSQSDDVTYDTVANISNEMNDINPKYLDMNTKQTQLYCNTENGPLPELSDLSIQNIIGTNVLMRVDSQDKNDTSQTYIADTSANSDHNYTMDQLIGKLSDSEINLILENDDIMKGNEFAVDNLVKISKSNSDVTSIADSNKSPCADLNKNSNITEDGSALGLGTFSDLTWSPWKNNSSSEMETLESNTKVVVMQQPSFHHFSEMLYNSSLPTYLLERDIHEVTIGSESNNEFELNNLLTDILNSSQSQILNDNTAEKLSSEKTTAKSETSSEVTRKEKKLPSKEVFVKTTKPKAQEVSPLVAPTRRYGRTLVKPGTKSSSKPKSPNQESTLEPTMTTRSTSAKTAALAHKLEQQEAVKVLPTPKGAVSPRGAKSPRATKSNVLDLKTGEIPPLAEFSDKSPANKDLKSPTEDISFLTLKPATKLFLSADSAVPPLAKINQTESTKVLNSTHTLNPAKIKNVTITEIRSPQQTLVKPMLPVKLSTNNASKPSTSTEPLVVNTVSSESLKNVGNVNERVVETNLFSGKKAKRKLESEEDDDDEPRHKKRNLTREELSMLFDNLREQGPSNPIINTNQSLSVNQTKDTAPTSNTSNVKVKEKPSVGSSATIELPKPENKTKLLPDKTKERPVLAVAPTVQKIDKVLPDARRSSFQNYHEISRAIPNQSVPMMDIRYRGGSRNDRRRLERQDPYFYNQSAREGRESSRTRRDTRSQYTPDRTYSRLDYDTQERSDRSRADPRSSDRSSSRWSGHSGSDVRRSNERLPHVDPSNRPYGRTRQQSFSDGYDRRNQSGRSAPIRPDSGRGNYDPFPRGEPRSSSNSSFIYGHGGSQVSSDRGRVSQNRSGGGVHFGQNTSDDDSSWLGAIMERAGLDVDSRPKFSPPIKVTEEKAGTSSGKPKHSK